MKCGTSAVGTTDRRRVTALIAATVVTVTNRTPETAVPSIITARGADHTAD